MSEQRYVRARDLQPGDMMRPDGRILKVEVYGPAVVIVAQRGEMVSTRTIRDREAWVEIITGEEIVHE